LFIASFCFGFLLNMADSFGDFIKLLPEEVVIELKKQWYDSLPALLCANSQDIGELDLKRGHIGIVRQAVLELQSKHGRGPLLEAQSSPRGSDGLEALSKLLGNLTTGRAAESEQKGQCLHIVDFVPSTMLAEEEVTLGGGVTLKVNAKPKLEKVSLGMWITANAKILQKLMDSDKHFDVRAYLQYTEMVGELATRYSWVSVLLFDDEYRKRQATFKSKWGADAPHLSTVTLRERPQPPPKAKPGNPTRHQGPPGREVCRQFNKGSCTYGALCKFDHACATCGSRDHPSRDHPAAAPAVASAANQ
jgi:hypothetical protein